MLLISIFSALATGRMSELSASVMDGAKNAVTIVISITGMMAFWSGMMRIAEKSGLAKKLSTFLFPILHFVFPSYKKGSDEIQAISMNVTANLLGIGNAATPFGIKAMQKMAEKNKYPGNDMVMFVLINTASIQLVPSTLCIIRKEYGSADPFEIIVAVWIVSFLVLLSVIISAKILQKHYE